MLARAENSGAARPALVDMVATQQKAREFEKPRLKRQRRAHTVAADLDQSSARTALQQLSVTAPTLKQYEKILAELATWITSRRASPLCEEEWDALVAAWMDEWFFEGQGANSGEKLLAAVLWKLPQFGRSAGGRMIQSRQALKGWRRVFPPGGRLPLPMAVVAMLAMEILWKGRPDIAVLVLLMMETYCRPSEPMRLRVRDVVPGQNKTGVRATAILLHPFECGVPAKNQQFDQTVLLDLPRHKALASALLRLCAGRRDDELVFSRAPPSLGPLFHEMGSQLRIEALGALHPYRLRHTGASFDFASSVRSLEQIQKRGRWNDPRSLRRYEHGGRLNELFARLEPDVIKHALKCEKLLSKVLSLQLSPCRCPWLRQSSWSSLQAQHD